MRLDPYLTPYMENRFQTYERHKEPKTPLVLGENIEYLCDLMVGKYFVNQAQKGLIIKDNNNGVFGYQISFLKRCHKVKRQIIR